MSTTARIGYVLKKFPRLSETFILNELLGLEALGLPIRVHSLTRADDEPRHAALELLRAPISDLSDSGGSSSTDLIDRLRSEGGEVAAERAVEFLQHLPEGRERRVLTKGLALAASVREHDLSHLHAHFLTVAAHTAYIAHLATGVPFSVTAHAKDIYRTGVDRWVFAEVAAAAKCVVTVCEANREFIVEHLVDDRATIDVVYNGLPLDSLPQAHSDRDPELILGVGRLVEKKGFDVLIEACRILRDSGDSFRCVIVGDGDQRDALVDQVGRYGLQGHVDLVGPATREAVFDLMRTARLLAAPCVTGDDGNRDALPTVIIEAMAVGLPVVAPPGGGIAEMVGDGGEGLLVPERDVPALVTTIRRALHDDEAWRSWSANGMETVGHRFDRQVTIRQLADRIGVSNASVLDGSDDPR
ncbi:MAG: glycosyltransferase [Ilumatobacteraceae bacterium]